MPPIEDPKLNQKEENYGIFYDNRHRHGFCLYYKGKKNSILRCASAGTELTIKGGRQGFKRLPKPLNWRGIDIVFYADVSIDTKNTGPVYTEINKSLIPIYLNHTEKEIINILLLMNVPNAENFKSDY